MRKEPGIEAQHENLSGVRFPTFCHASVNDEKFYRFGEIQKTKIGSTVLHNCTRVLLCADLVVQLICSEGNSDTRSDGQR